MKTFVFLSFCLFMIYACQVLKESADNPNLEGSIWKLVAINEKPYIRANNTAFIKFDDDKITGKAGCNTFGGGIEQIRNQIAFEEIITTKMFCEGLMDEENNILSNLQKVKRYEVKADMLYLYDLDRLLLTYRR